MYNQGPEHSFQNKRYLYEYADSARRKKILLFGIVLFLIATGLFFTYAHTALTCLRTYGDSYVAFSRYLMVCVGGILIALGAAVVPLSVWHNHAPLFLGLALISSLILPLHTQTGLFSYVRFYGAGLLSAASLLQASAFLTKVRWHRVLFFGGEFAYMLVGGGTCYVLFLHGGAPTALLLAMTHVLLFLIGYQRVTQRTVLLGAGSLCALIFLQYRFLWACLRSFMTHCTIDTLLVTVNVQSGVFGAAVLLLFYYLFFVVGVSLIKQSKPVFMQYVISSLIIWVSLQALAGFTFGIPLPFISYQDPHFLLFALLLGISSKARLN